jgi:cell wall-associated NlpC family hydrolase
MTRFTNYSARTRTRISTLAIAAALVAVTSLSVTALTAEDTDAAASVSPAISVETTTAETQTATVLPTAELISSKKSKKTTINFTPAKLVKVAKRYAGIRYSYGGSSPSSGFDCSGFTKFIYAKFGVDLPHSAWAQGQKGHRVSKAKAKPGDLVITSGGSHVGIWVSKGKFIDAPKPGQSVHVRKIYTSNYYIVRVESTSSKA